MEAGFSEFAFVYSHVKELEMKYKWRMPYFPTTNEEAGKGYDLRIDSPVLPIYLQYKVSHYLNSPNSAEWKDFEEPYFRFCPYPARRSEQHNLLRTLYKNTYGEAFYCAPRFVQEKSLCRYREHNQVVENSVFILCRTLPEIKGNDKHHICYAENLDYGFMYSEKTELDIFTIKKLEDKLKEKIKKGMFPLKEALMEINAVLYQLMKKEQNAEQSDAVKYSRYVEKFSSERPYFPLGSNLNESNFKQNLGFIKDYLASKGILLVLVTK